MTIYSESPCRLSLFGGGTDLPVFFNDYGGCVVNLAINIKHRMKIVIQKDGEVFMDIPEGASRKFYEEIFKDSNINTSDVALTHTFDGRIESGLGSSAAAAVALVAGLKRLQNVTDRHAIANIAWDIEVNKHGLYGGLQDQYASAFGGFNYMYFESNDKTHFNVTLKQFSRDIGNSLTSHLLLFHTGIIRKNTKIQEQLKNLSEEKVEKLKSLKDIALQSLGYIDQGNWEKVGWLLHMAWEEKKKSNSLVSTPEIDNIYNTAIKHGAWGGKLCGSGGGGYIFFLSDPKFHDKITGELKNLGCTPVDFQIDYNGVSTRII